MSDNERFRSFTQSLRRLEEALKKRRTVANRDSAIQRFEFTFELAWKSLQDAIRAQGNMCRSPKECLKEAFRLGLTRDDARWLRMLDDRNRTVHTYDEETAEKVYRHLPRYLRLFQDLRDALRARLR